MLHCSVLAGLARCFFIQPGSAKAFFQFVENILGAQLQFRQHNQCMKPEVSSFMNQFGFIDIIFDIALCY